MELSIYKRNQKLLIKEKTEKLKYTKVIPTTMKENKEEVEEDKIVFIKVRTATREDLKRCGIKGDTYDVIIRRFIERVAKENAVKIT